MQFMPAGEAEVPKASIGMEKMATWRKYMIKRRVIVRGCGERITFRAEEVCCFLYQRLPKLGCV